MNLGSEEVLLFIVFDFLLCNLIFNKFSSLKLKIERNLYFWNIILGKCNLFH